MIVIIMRLCGAETKKGGLDLTKSRPIVMLAIFV